MILRIIVLFCFFATLLDSACARASSKSGKDNTKLTKHLLHKEFTTWCILYGGSSYAADRKQNETILPSFFSSVSDSNITISAPPTSSE